MRGKTNILDSSNNESNIDSKSKEDMINVKRRKKDEARSDKHSIINHSVIIGKNYNDELIIL